MTPSRSDSSRIAPPQLPARPLPRHPRNRAAPDLVDQLLAVGGAGQGDDAVGVQVVDVRVVDQCVHGGVDRRRGTARPVAAVGEQADHLVLVLDAAVDLVQAHQPVALEHREAVGGEGAEVAAGALDVEQLHRFAAGRAGDGHLGRGVAAAVVRDGRVRAEPVAAVQQRADLVREHGVASGMAERSFHEVDEAPVCVFERVTLCGNGFDWFRCEYETVDDLGQRRGR